MAQTSEFMLQGAWQPQNGSPSLDPTFGGEFGWATNPVEWLGAQAHIPRNLIPIVLDTPSFFQYMPDSAKWVAAGKLLWEKQARSIEGLKDTLTVDTSEHAFGGDGRMFEEFVDVKRERSTLSLGMIDKYGQVWQNYLHRVIRYGMMDPETKVPMTSTIDGANQPDLLASQYSWTIAFIQPDPRQKSCMRCWICVNVWPKTTGPIEGKMDKTASLTQSDLSLDFTCLDFVNEGTRQIGQQLLTNMNLSRGNPYLQEAFIKEIAPDVKAIAKGYEESITRIAQGAVAGV